MSSHQHDEEDSWEPGWLDRQFRDIPLIALILFSCCCGEITLIFGILGIVLCKDPAARGNALIVFAVSAIRFCVMVAGIAVGVYLKR